MCERNPEILDKPVVREAMLELTIGATAHSSIAVMPTIGAAKRGVALSEAKLASDEAAVNASQAFLRKYPYPVNIFNSLAEGKKDKSFFMEQGFIVLKNRTLPTIRIGEDSLECTKNAATGEGPSSSIMVATDGETLYAWPDELYANRLVVGKLASEAGVSARNSIKENVDKITSAHDKDVTELRIAILDRERNKPIISELERLSINPILLTDGDCMPAVNTCIVNPQTGKPFVDAQMGIGGGTETLLQAVAVEALGGSAFMAEWRKDDPVMLNGVDADEIITASDMVSGDDLVFCATGINDGGYILRGLAKDGSDVITHTLQILRYGGVVKVETICSIFDCSNEQPILIERNVERTYDAVR
jgi:fructose-1,6-bisphosphatase II